MGTMFFYLKFMEKSEKCKSLVKNSFSSIKSTKVFYTKKNQKTHQNPTSTPPFPKPVTSQPLQRPSKPSP